MKDGLPPRCATRFRAVRWLGRGGSADVWEALQLDLDRPVAIKVLRASQLEDKSFLRRLEDEARLTAALQSAHIVRVVDFDAADLLPWIAYEFLPGYSLRRRLEGSRLEWDEGLKVARQVTSALEEAHLHGVLHRDIKPDNIIQASRETFKVADFGIARLSGSGDRQTVAGLVMGTPEYVAPEVIRGGDATELSDLYSLGVTLYEIVTGRVPFHGGTVQEIVRRQCTEPPRSPGEIVPSLPPGVVALILRMLEKNPRRRFPSATVLGAFIDALVASGGLLLPPALDPESQPRSIDPDPSLGPTPEPGGVRSGARSGARSGPRSGPRSAGRASPESGARSGEGLAEGPGTRSGSGAPSGSRVRSHRLPLPVLGAGAGLAAVSAALVVTLALHGTSTPTVIKSAPPVTASSGAPDPGTSRPSPAPGFTEQDRDWLAEQLTILSQGLRERRRMQIDMAPGVLTDGADIVEGNLQIVTRLRPIARAVEARVYPVQSRIASVPDDDALLLCLARAKSYRVWELEERVRGVDTAGPGSSGDSRTGLPPGPRSAFDVLSAFNTAPSGGVTLEKLEKVLEGFVIGANRVGQNPRLHGLRVGAFLFDVWYISRGSVANRWETGLEPRARTAVLKFERSLERVLAAGPGDLHDAAMATLGLWRNPRRQSRSAVQLPEVAECVRRLARPDRPGAPVLIQFARTLASGTADDPLAPLANLEVPGGR